jgi:hypothetical protein
MNQQGTLELEEQPGYEKVTRDWEESEWFQEWLARHEQDTVEKEN